MFQFTEHVISEEQGRDHIFSRDLGTWAFSHKSTTTTRNTAFFQKKKKDKFEVSHLYIIFFFFFKFKGRPIHGYVR